jgi:hypothetical protein
MRLLVDACVAAVQAHAAELTGGAIVTVLPGQMRVRRGVRVGGQA